MGIRDKVGFASGRLAGLSYLLLFFKCFVLLFLLLSL
jgi:hypothetical protein